MEQKMSDQKSEHKDHRLNDDLMDQVLSAMESAIGQKYVGYFPEQNATRIKRIEPDNSALLDLYHNAPEARKLIDMFVASGPEELAVKLGLPELRGD